MEVTCDNCNKVFPIKLKEKRHPKTIIETFFVCSHCKHRYTSFATDAEVRRLQRIIKRPMSADERLDMLNKIKKQMAILKYELINGKG